MSSSNTAALWPVAAMVGLTMVVAGAVLVGMWAAFVVALIGTQ